jgi:hypothetical protein
MVCVVMAAVLATGCGVDKDADGTSGSARTDTTQASADSTAPALPPAEATNARFTRDPADAKRPAKPREEVAGVSPPAIPRRTCTLPQRGCVTASGDEDFAKPPAPGVDISRVTETSIDLVYDLGSDLGGCQPSRLTVAVYTTISGLPPTVDDYPVSGLTGTLRIEPRALPGDVDFGPPDILFISSETAEGLSSESASVALPAPEGEAHLSAAEARRIKADREACRADIGDRTTCEMGGLHPVSGPVTATPAELRRSVRTSLEAYGGFSILHVKCVNGTRCDAAFAIDKRRLDMSYRIEALVSVPTCWELTAFSVTRPVPELSNLAAPLPNRGCVDR